ncbi:YciI family protein [Tahibacter soli]|uniref:YciI family protein n=1 Tax=Tahibacter soli TaxID=2983605 RepID=A0A9X3YNB6_9GAMM|nr:YciI family protein [Tahibacter soli]MDC8014480.1 YciI family protein [Tahibacter soli]
MLYAILCYNDENITDNWTAEEDAEVMARLGAVQQELAKQGKLGPVARLQPTRTAKTVRKSDNLLLVDGPFAETKEQLLGFYIVDCETSDEAADIARRLAAANRGVGGYEIRPVGVFFGNAQGA